MEWTCKSVTIPEPLKPENTPPYPSLGPAVARSRALAWKDPTKRREHGENVLRAIRALQIQELRRASPGRMPRCASGTVHTDGRKILEAVNKQNVAAFEAAVRRDRASGRTVSGKTIEEAYREAMEEKRSRPAQFSVSPEPIVSAESFLTDRAKVRIPPMPRPARSVPTIAF